MLKSLLQQRTACW